MQKKLKRNPEKGGMTILFAVGGLALMGMAALAMEAGYMMVTRAELQNVADVAASSANLELGRIYEEAGNVDPKDYLLTQDDKSRIFWAANRFSLRNQAAGKSIWLHPSDMKFGTWDGENREMIETEYGVTTVSLSARRDAYANGRVSTLMASVAGLNNFGAKASAVGQVSQMRKLPAGKGDFPVGIASHWFDNKNSPCGPDSRITFYPTGTLDGCAGWHTFEDDPANAQKLKEILTAIEADTWESPELITGETYYNFTGGTVASALQKAKDAYNARKDADGKWLVHIPVYEASDCSNPGGWIKIIGVATAVIDKVVPTADKVIEGEIQCDVVMYGKGGGPDYGTHVGMGQLVN